MYAGETWKADVRQKALCLFLEAPARKQECGYGKVVVLKAAAVG